MKITREMKRKIIQIIAFGYSNSYIGNFASGQIYKGKWKQFCNPGLNCYSCPAARLACPIGALQAVDGSMNFSLSFYVIGFLLAVGVLFGRAICGFICPFGFLQELLYKIPFPKKKLPKPFTYLKYVILVVFVIALPIFVTNVVGMGAPAFCEYICPAGTLEGGIPLLLTHSELRQTIGSLFFVKFVILIGTIIGCLMVVRFFCKVICPLGAIYGLLNKISLHHMEINRDTCISCKKCEASCPMDVNLLSNLRSAECIHCGKCVSVCPKESISFRFRIK